ncbi:MAG: DinB family protein [Bacteroidota bacterium]|uniref:DinB family protein n=1 Tax=Flagellimonas okinawensis TaxID=3031324 RepID=A0ABT5XR80_9FLAO|nr:DinB family protein [[Muricauda] okinawensis]MDF0708101.1 DinB family protein [[Muricauda] okinawensis]MEC8832510.1 DinB family protein [Bacteroidota bacterium]
MFKSSLETLEQFKQVLSDLPLDCYSRSCDILSNATIGQHTRHIIELYLCLINGYEFSDVSYDRRERNLRIEEDLDYALDRLTYIQEHLEKQNKSIKINYELSGGENSLDSNYFREVMYNLEHTIHHQALIKVGIKHLSSQEIPESFGVAPSTLQYRKVCAQ